MELEKGRGTTYVKLPLEFPIASEFDKDDFVE